MAGDTGTQEEHRQAADRRRKELDQFFSNAYEELRRLAASVRRSLPNSPLSPTTLVNEAWMKLAKSAKLPQESELPFKSKAARAMRDILVEAARRHGAHKRGGPSQFVTFDDSLLVSCGPEMVALD